MKKINLTAELLFVLLPVLACVTGCGSSEALTSTDQQNAYARVTGLGDVASDESAFSEAFVPGSLPENRKDYTKFGYDIGGVATFEGDTAVIPVTIFGGVYDSAQGDRAGRKPSSQSEIHKKWTLQQVDGDWKIKDAPLT
ncbi:hypothetical protein [Planctomycetes bacterium K23_9]|uniref:DUF4440 domain-containing protein n=1 Tax=Stieleria marina TaxID=1930275 RepID=A0A517NRF9_9BACT|nr:hypothetical protein K239x_16690 [Planctomycetes bacterium K23_9]